MRTGDLLRRGKSAFVDGGGVNKVTVPFTNDFLVNNSANITHNLDSTDVIVSVYDNINAQIIPDEVIIKDKDNVSILLSSFVPLEGIYTAVILGGGATPTPDTYYTSYETDILLSKKQELLLNGINIKTINGESILGSGNLEIKGGSSAGLYAFEINEQGDLILSYTDNTTPPLYIINEQGELILTYEDDEPTPKQEIVDGYLMVEI